MQTALSIVTAIDELQEDPGADKAGQLADILSNLTRPSQLLTTLSLNPVIGVFIGLYATALKSAMIPIQIIADQVAIRGEVIESSTAGIDIEAELAEQDAAAESAADAQLAVSEQLSALHARRSELIADLQGGQYVVALDFAASRHPDEMRELISIASEQGGITSDAAVNGETLGQIETWVGSATEASFDLMTEAAAAPEGSEARADAIESLDTLNDARHRVGELLGPIRGTVTGALETYGYSTADPGPQASVSQAAGTAGGIAGLSRRAVMIGGGGIFAIAMVGLVLLLPGGGDAGNPGESGGSSSSGSSSSGSGSSGSGSSGSGSSGSGSAGVVATAPPTACELRREEQIVLDFSSPEIGLDSSTGALAIPELYNGRDSYTNEFRTPSFQWSQVPPEATEIAILIFHPTSATVDEFLNLANPWWDGPPTGVERWVATGIDPAVTSLSNSSLSIPLPAGVIEHRNLGPGVSIEGADGNSRFVGPFFPERHFIFAVFALCDRQSVTRDLYRGHGLMNDAIAVGWFMAEPPW